MQSLHVVHLPAVWWPYLCKESQGFAPDGVRDHEHLQLPLKLALQAEEEGGAPAAAPSKAALKRARKKAAAAAAAAAALESAAAGPVSMAAANGAAATSLPSAAHASAAAAAASAPDMHAAGKNGSTSLPCSAAASGAAGELPAPAARGVAAVENGMQQLCLQHSTAAGPSVPDWMVCPLTHAVLVDPVLCTGDGQTYERAAITQWLAALDSQTSPVTGQPLVSRDLVPNHALRSIIQAAQARSSRQ